MNFVTYWRELQALYDNAEASENTMMILRCLRVAHDLEELQKACQWWERSLFPKDFLFCQIGEEE